MRLNKLSIRNFRNFQSIDIALSGNVVLLGQNRVGKSNLLFAIQLILDPTLPDSARQLKLIDFWDGGRPNTARLSRYIWSFRISRRTWP